MTEHSVKQHGAVLFYGFRQIEENPAFYALAEAFILPSLYEEWGLVVNEAMAAGLPVIVSRTAGCAEDLLPARGQLTSAEWRVRSEAGRSGPDAPGTFPASGNTAGPEVQPYLGEATGGVDPHMGGQAAAATAVFNSTPSTANSLEERSNGFVFDPASVEALAEAMQRVAASKEQRMSMGERSREIISRWGCDNFARQALRAAESAEQR